MLNPLTCLFPGFCTVFLLCYFRATWVVWTQATVTYGIWYIYESILIWIIPSTYQPHKSIIWAYITSFVHTYIYRMFMCIYALYIIFHACFLIQIYWYTCIYSISDLLSFPLCYLSLPVLVYLSHLTWSCTRVTAWARQLILSYVLGGCFLTTLDSHVQILESGPWRPYCSWFKVRSGSVH